MELWLGLGLPVMDVPVMDVPGSSVAGRSRAETVAGWLMAARKPARNTLTAPCSKSSSSCSNTCEPRIFRQPFALAAYGRVGGDGSWGLSARCARVP